MGGWACVLGAKELGFGSERGSELGIVLRRKGLGETGGLGMRIGSPSTRYRMVWINLLIFMHVGRLAAWSAGWSGKLEFWGRDNHFPSVLRPPPCTCSLASEFPWSMLSHSSLSFCDSYSLCKCRWSDGMRCLCLILSMRAGWRLLCSP